MKEQEISAIHIHQKLNSNILMATTSQQRERIMQYIKTNYKKLFPEITVGEGDHYIANSFVFYTQDENGVITSTASLEVDSPAGFPEESLLKDDIQCYRDQGLNCLQIGRFVIDKKNEKDRVKDYFKLFYQFSKQLGYDIIVGMIKQKDRKFHQNLLGAKVLCEDTKVSYGGKNVFATAVWELHHLNDRFFKWIDCQPIKDHQTIIYQPAEWDQYARSFAGVQTSFQRDLQLASAELLTGHVADFGCGSAKLAPFLCDKTAVSSYIGIDYSTEMIKIANWLIAHFNCPTFSTFEGKIEDYQGKIFDSAVSLNSYYTWPDPANVLQHIHSLLKTNGTFVLATPNTKLDMLAMDRQARKELLTHPNYEQFRKINLELTNNDNAQFIDMDDLIKQVQSVGFTVVSCHQGFYLGGLNFLVLNKADTNHRC